MPPTRPSPAGAAIPRLDTAVIGFVGAAEAGPVDAPVTVASPEDYHASFGPSLDADRPLGHAVDLFFANGGRSAVVVRAAGPAPEQLVPAEGPGGVHALDDSGITVLVVPGLTAAHHDQVRVALGRCAAYRAVLLLDLPPGPWTSATAATLEGIEQHRDRTAVYHPWVLTGGVAVPPSGAVAGVIARTDRDRGVWKAPAGVGLVGIEGLCEGVDSRLSEELVQLGVNPLREFAGRGAQVWGARTLAAAQSTEPARRYLNVRRLTDHVLASLSAGLAFVQERRSEEALWLRVRQLTDGFLHELWRQGALQGSRPQHAYLARCGPGETMTQGDVDLGAVVLLVGLASVRPAEFDVHHLRWQAAVPVAGPPPASSSSASGAEPGDQAEGGAGDGAVALDRVVSRYLGETEKNLSRLLDRAERSGKALVLDEADALFGKRTQVSDAHDRFADQEVSDLIEKMARERGVAVRWRRGRPPPPP